MSFNLILCQQAIQRAVRQFEDKGLEQLAERMVEIVHSSIEYYFVAIYILSNGEGLKFVAGSGEAGKILAKMKWVLPVNNPLLKETIQSGETRLINALTEEVSRFSINITEEGKQRLNLKVTEPIKLYSPLLADTSWYLYLPLINNERIFGVFEIQSSEQTGFEYDDIISFKEVADTIASSLAANL